MDKPHFEYFSGIPIKQIRDNAIATLDLHTSKLEAFEGIILAHCLTSNSSVTQVDVSNNGLQPEGGKALADCLKINTTITQVR